ncbi:MAG: fumarylacetoacetate hydrolase family protein [Acidobacteriia bacterium]|nr:fumarylacetoacetate hydrolase family protein [Terriglobia bacterium]
MKLLSYEVGGVQSYGALKDGAIVDLARRLGSDFPTLKQLLAGSALRKAEEAVANAKPDYALDDIRFQLPIPVPEKIICVGVNYPERNAEYKDNSNLQERPSLFLRVTRSFVPHRANLIRPPESRQLDYEGELAVVIGKPGRRIAAEKAMEHVAGFTILNEGTIRDWIRHAKFNNTQGKNWEKSGSIGPWIATPDEFPNLEEIQITTRVNGKLRQQDKLGNMLFPIPYLVNYISTFTELAPGDVIATGTPTGAGARMDPPCFLVPGDTVEIEVSGLGTLSNAVADEH